MCGRGSERVRRGAWLALPAGLLLAATPAAAHNLPAAELARLNEWVARAADGGWLGLLLLLGSGVVLGALHGLEPGHAKTMMSAFIVAIRGTVGQAALLGASATVAHTAVVWVLVLPVLLWGGAADFARREPYFQVVSALLVLAVAGWTLLRVWRAGRPAAAGPAERVLDTGHGLLRLALERREGAWRLLAHGVARSGRPIGFAEDFAIDAAGPLALVAEGAGWVSAGPVAAPERFRATLRLGHGDHEHLFEVAFGAGAAVAEDAHERAHAEALARQLAGGRDLSRWQIVLFGLSGGLLPCPAAVTVLLLCLQLKQVGLGVLLVASFSLGLAATMIGAGAVASLGVRRLGARSAAFAAWARPATFASCALILAIGLYMLAQGIDALA